MEIQLLEELMLIHKHGSIRKAAAELQVSPAALSQRMTALENSLGTQLLQRTRQQTKLTPQGELFAKDTAHFLSLYHKSMDRVTADDADLYRSLKIAITGDLMPFPLASVLDSLNFRYPKLHLELLDDRSFDVGEGLSKGYVDLYFTFCYDDIAIDGLQTEPLFFTNSYAIVRNDHRLARRTSVTLPDLDGEQFILYPKSGASHIRQRQMKMLENSGIQHDIYDTDAPHSMYAFLLPIGKGILLSPWAMQGKLTPNAVAIPLEEKAGISSYSMLYRADNENPALQKIVSEIRDVIGEEIR